MLIEKETGTIFQNRLQAKKVMGTKRYYQFVQDGKIEFVELNPFRED